MSIGNAKRQRPRPLRRRWSHDSVRYSRELSANPPESEAGMTDTQVGAPAAANARMLPRRSAGPPDSARAHSPRNSLLDPDAGALSQVPLAAGEIRANSGRIPALAAPVPGSPYLGCGDHVLGPEDRVSRTGALNPCPPPESTPLQDLPLEIYSERSPSASLTCCSMACSPRSASPQFIHKTDGWDDLCWPTLSDCDRQRSERE